MKKIFLFAIMSIVALGAFTLVSCDNDESEPEKTPDTYSAILGGTIEDKSTCTDVYHLCLDYTITEGSKAAVTKTIDVTKGEKLPEKVVAAAPATISCKPYFKKIGEPVADKLYDMGFSYDIYIHAMKNDYVADRAASQMGVKVGDILGADLESASETINATFSELTLSVSENGTVTKK